VIWPRPVFHFMAEPTLVLQMDVISDLQIVTVFLFSPPLFQYISKEAHSRPVPPLLTQVLASWTYDRSVQEGLKTESRLLLLYRYRLILWYYLFSSWLELYLIDVIKIKSSTLWRLHHVTGVNDQQGSMCHSDSTVIFLHLRFISPHTWQNVSHSTTQESPPTT
jgi:hypothetical protein